MYYAFLLDTDHFQFYLEDLTIDHNTSDLWTSPAADHHVDIRDGLIAIGTARWGQNTPITIALRAQPPVTDDFDPWDWVIETSIRSSSGHLHLTTPEGDDHMAPSLVVPAGTYRVRIHFGHVEQVAHEEAQQGPDTYDLVLWPGEPSEPRILKAP